VGALLRSRQPGRTAARSRLRPRIAIRAATTQTSSSRGPARVGHGVMVGAGPDRDVRSAGPGLPAVGAHAEEVEAVLGHVEVVLIGDGSGGLRKGTFETGRRVDVGDLAARTADEVVVMP
jgi:hypothetical protein